MNRPRTRRPRCPSRVASVTDIVRGIPVTRVPSSTASPSSPSFRERHSTARERHAVLADGKTYGAMNSAA